jgi:hypothetical protein
VLPDGSPDVRHREYMAGIRHNLARSTVRLGVASCHWQPSNWKQSCVLI